MILQFSIKLHPVNQSQFNEYQLSQLIININSVYSKQQYHVPQSYNYPNTIFQLLLQRQMILNLNKPNVNKQPQNNLMSSQSFLLKNKITINQVTHTHFTVQGVQMYSPAQIQALKLTQQRTKTIQNKQAVQTKVYQIADYFDQFQQSKQLNPKQKVQELHKTKYSKDLAKRIVVDKTDIKSQNNLTVKQKVTKNKMTLTKLDKSRNKKNALQNKLAYLSKHYKQYFNQQNQQLSKSHQSQKQLQQNNQLQQNQSLTQSIQKITKSNQNNHSDQQSNQLQLQIQNNQIKNNKNTPFTKNNKKTLSNSSTKYTKPTNKLAKSSLQGNKKEEDSQIVDFEDVQEGLNMIGEMISNKSTYSQKLGSAVHQLFN